MVICVCERLKGSKVSGEYFNVGTGCLYMPLWSTQAVPQQQKSQWRCKFIQTGVRYDVTSVSSSDVQSRVRKFKDHLE